MTVYIWVSANQRVLDATFGVALKALRPDIPVHRFVSWNEGEESPPLGKGDILLAAGERPLSTLRREKVIPKGKSLGSLRENLIPKGDGFVLATFDPFIVLRDFDKRDLLSWDVRLAQRAHDTGSPKPIIGKYRYVPDFQESVDRINHLYEETGSPVFVAIDLETMGFHPWYHDKDIITMQVTVDVGCADVLYLGPQECSVKPMSQGDVSIYDQVKFLLTSDRVKIRGANLKFDLLWIKMKWGIHCTNFKFDTMLVGSLLNENRSNSLSNHAKQYTRMGGYDSDFDKKYDKGHMENVPPGEDLLTYAGGDTDACQQVADKQRQELLREPALASFYVTVLHPAARAFEEVERRGVLVDLDKFSKLRDDLTEIIDKGYKDALKILPRTLKEKYRDRISAQLKDGKNPLLPVILKDYFFGPRGLNLKPKQVTEKTGEPSMAKSHLKMFADHPDAAAMVEVLTEADVAAKTRSTFVDGFVKCVRPDGRIHPTYFLGRAEFEGFSGDSSGTNTGRLSAKDPAFQIIPKKTKWAKRIRECYPAPPGKALIAADYSQGELRVVSCVANEKNMIRAYQDNMDLHSLTGSQLVKVPYDEFFSWKASEDAERRVRFSMIRDRAKAGNFGLLYGMMAPGFQAYAWANYGIVLTLEEAEEIRRLFFEGYPGLLAYHERQKKLVNLHGAVRSPLGRVAHLPMINSRDWELKSKAERKAINSPIQSCLSDMLLWSIALIEEAYPNGEIEVIGMIHDSLMAYVDADKVNLRASQIVEIMSNLPFEKVCWEPQLSFPADVEAGPNWAEMKSLDLK